MCRSRDTVGTDIKRCYTEALLDHTVSRATKHLVGRNREWFSGTMIDKCNRKWTGHPRGASNASRLHSSNGSNQRPIVVIAGSFLVQRTARSTINLSLSRNPSANPTFASSVAQSIPTIEISSLNSRNPRSD